MEFINPIRFGRYLLVFLLILSFCVNYSVSWSTASARVSQDFSSPQKTQVHSFLGSTNPSTNTLSGNITTALSNKSTSAASLVQQARLAIDPTCIFSLPDISSDGNTVAMADECTSHHVKIYGRNGQGIWGDPISVTVATEPDWKLAEITSVALSGDGNTLIVGVIDQVEYFGATYIFVRNGTSWQLQQKFTNFTDYGSTFGGEVAINDDGNTAVISAEGRSKAFIYQRNAGSWSLKQTLNRPVVPDLDYWGVRVAISGDGSTVLVSSPSDYKLGVVYVYKNNGSNNWVQVQALTASDGSKTDGFGWALALNQSGNVIVVGNANRTTEAIVGEVHIFVNSGTSWIEQQKLIGPSPSKKCFGVSVAIDKNADAILVGAVCSNSGSVEPGAAYLFRQSGSTWSLQQTLTSYNSRSFGQFVKVNGDATTVLVESFGLDDTSAVNHSEGSYIFVPRGPAFRITAPVTASIGSPITFTVTALDQSGSVATNYTGTVHFVSSDSSASIPPDYTFVPADNGTHTFSNALTFTKEGSQSLSALDTAFNPDNVIATTNVFVQPAGSPTYIYKLPYLANNANGVSTYLAFQNTGNSTAAFQLQYFDTNGSPITAVPNLDSVSCTNFVAKAECLPPSPFGNNANGASGTAILVANQPLSVIVAEGTPAGGSAYTATADNGATSTLIAPIVLHQAYGDYNTSLSIFNSSINFVPVTVKFYDQNGTLYENATNNITIAPYTSLLLDQAGPESNLPSGFIGWAQISGPGGSELTAQVLEQSQNQHFVAIAATQPQGQNTLYAPAIFNNAFGGFVSGVNLVNPGSQSVTVNMTYYDQNGRSYQTAPFDIAPFATTAIYQPATTGKGVTNGGLPVGFYGSATITTTGGTGVVMQVNEIGSSTSKGTSKSGTYAAQTSGSNLINLPVIAKGGFGYTTGLTVLNVSNTTINGSLTYYNLDGTIQGNPHSFTIPANSSQAIYQGAEALPTNFYGTAVVTAISAESGDLPSNSLLVTTNALSSNSFYAYTEPAK